MKYQMSGVAILLAVLSCGCATTRYIPAPRDASDAVTCGQCAGIGKVKTCPDCKGQGSVMEMMVVNETYMTGSGLNSSFQSVPTLQNTRVTCRTCSGRGVIPAVDGGLICSQCNGTGRVYPVDSKGNRVLPK